MRSAKILAMLFVPSRGVEASESPLRGRQRSPAAMRHCGQQYYVDEESPDPSINTKAADS